MWYEVCFRAGMVKLLGRVRDHRRPTRSCLAHFAVLAIASAAALATGCSILGDPGSSESDVQASPYWKNKLTFPQEPFAASGGSGQLRWVKFSIFVDDPTKVYFQDSNKYAFHYEFAKNHLPGFGGMSPTEFAKVTLKAEGQRLVSGAVLMPPLLQTMEFGIQLLREDEYSKEDVKRFHDLVKANVVVEGGRTAKAFYMPSYEQSVAAERERAWLESHGVDIASAGRWLTADGCYAPGWAFGTAKFFPGSEITQAYLDGRLTMNDVLVTDGVPAEVPYVAAIVSLAPSTPSSHVAILSHTWGIPFVYPASESTRARVRALDGREVALRTVGDVDVYGNEYCALEVIEPASPVDAQTRAELAELRKPPPVTIPIKTPLGALTRKTVDLRPADAKYFGGKASNFGTLRRRIPANSPNALGVSFDLWDAFLAQTMPSGKTLEQEIDERLGGVAFPPDLRWLEARLQELRTLVTDVAVLPTAEQTRLFAELRAFGFDPKIKLRFRSSTNVEDGDVLSGAGLYDSYSGCLADDLDGDTAGPSACDAAEPKEKGAERAIKKVFASFFNTNAVLERLKYGIPEASVGMALAVHYSFPDEREAANGVATVRLSPWGSTQVQLVTQVGAESVTNPDGGAIPETVSVQLYGPQDGDVGVTLLQGSSRLPLGGTVMKWEEDYRGFARLMEQASGAFKLDHGIGDEDLAIDIEYKKDTDGTLILKQIRRLPQRSRAPSITPVLLDEATRLCTAQGEFADVLANHRLKVEGALAMRSTKLSAAVVGRPLVTSLDFAVVENGVMHRMSGDPASFAEAAHTNEGDVIRDSWSAASGPASLEISNFRGLVAPSESPLVVARDYRWLFTANYATPRPTISSEGVGETRQDIVMLERCNPEISPDVQTIEAVSPTGVRVKTRFHYNKPRSGFDKTSSLGKWVDTEIRGLTAQPIVLKGFFSQTFRPQHHNFNEDFMFEPGLEEGLPPAIRDELAAKDIQAIVMTDAARGSEQAKFYVLKRSTQRLEAL